MQVEPPHVPLSSKIISRIWLAVIILFVWGMQIGLTYAIFVNSNENRHQPSERLGWTSWAECLRLTGLLYSMDLIEENDLRAASVTVCKDELIVLFEKFHFLGEGSFSEPAELLRANLTTGHLTRSPPPIGVRSVFSDGKILWLLPGFRDGHASVFLWDGVPSTICPSKETWTPKLVQFVQGQWRETERCMLMIESRGSFPTVDDSGIDQSNGQLHSWVYDRDGFYFRRDLQFGTEQDYDEFRKHYRFPLAPEEIAQIGWHSVVESWLPGKYVPLGFWFDHDQPFAIALKEHPMTILSHTGVDAPRDYQGLYWGPISQPVKADGPNVRAIDRDRPVESTVNGFQSHDAPQFARFPAPWSIGSTGMDIDFRVVHSYDGRIFVLCRHQDDGRLHLFELVNGELKLVAFQRGWLIRRVCLEAAVLLTIIVSVPMLLLGLAVSVRQRPPMIESGVSSVVAASIMRRGAARAIDLFLVGSLFVLSVVLHPDVMSWWTEIVLELKYPWEAGLYFSGNGIGTEFVVLERQLHAIAKVMFAVPVIPWLLITSLILETLQLAWQARTGRTVGKWLVGIKALRTTHRPCGVARSLFREILLVIDSLCLVSWVPGVIAILSTRRGQRIGDYWADTIVVRDVRQIPSIQFEADRSLVVGSEAKPTLPLNEVVN